MTHANFLTKLNKQLPFQYNSDHLHSYLDSAIRELSSNVSDDSIRAAHKFSKSLAKIIDFVNYRQQANSKGGEIDSVKLKTIAQTLKILGDSQDYISAKILKIEDSIKANKLDEADNTLVALEMFISRQEKDIIKEFSKFLNDFNHYMQKLVMKGEGKKHEKLMDKFEEFNELLIDRMNDVSKVTGLLSLIDKKFEQIVKADVSMPIHDTPIPHEYFDDESPLIDAAC